jgi:3'(2'), 5'-bisphosphate nucleotidase
VLAAAGGAVVRFDDGAPLAYGRADRANPFFLAYGRRAPRPRA